MKRLAVGLMLSFGLAQSPLFADSEPPVIMRCSGRSAMDGELTRYELVEGKRNLYNLFATKGHADSAPPKELVLSAMRCSVPFTREDAALSCSKGSDVGDGPQSVLKVVKNGETYSILLQTTTIRWGGAPQLTEKQVDENSIDCSFPYQNRI